jgi:hypothetical protein
VLVAHNESQLHRLPVFTQQFQQVNAPGLGELQTLGANPLHLRQLLPQLGYSAPLRTSYAVVFGVVLAADLNLELLIG